VFDLIRTWSFGYIRSFATIQTVHGSRKRNKKTLPECYLSSEKQQVKAEADARYIINQE